MFKFRFPQLKLHALPSIAWTRLGPPGAEGQAAQREPGRVQTSPRVSDPTCATVELKARSKSPRASVSGPTTSVILFYLRSSVPLPEFFSDS